MRRKLQKENAADKEPRKYAGPRPTSRDFPAPAFVKFAQGRVYGGRYFMETA